VAGQQELLKVLLQPMHFDDPVVTHHTLSLSHTQILSTAGRDIALSQCFRDLAALYVLRLFASILLVVRQLLVRLT